MVKEYLTNNQFSSQRAKYNKQRAIACQCLKATLIAAMQIFHLMFCLIAEKYLQKMNIKKNSKISTSLYTPHNPSIIKSRIKSNGWDDNKVTHALFQHRIGPSTNKNADKHVCQYNDIEIEEAGK